MQEMTGQAMGMSVAYRPIDLAVLDVGPEDLADILAWAQRFGFTGLNITAPCKQQVIGLLDSLSDRAAALRAVNTVVFREGKTIGHNTDWCGFAHSLQRNLPHADRGRPSPTGCSTAVWPRSPSSTSTPDARRRWCRG